MYCFFSVSYTCNFVFGHVFTKNTTHDKYSSFFSAHSIAKIVYFHFFALFIFIPFRFSMLLFWDRRNHLSKTRTLFLGRWDSTESEAMSQNPNKKQWHLIMRPALQKGSSRRSVCANTDLRKCLSLYRISLKS